LEEYAENPTIACRGCGLPMHDRRGDWPPLLRMDSDERAAYEAQDAAWRNRHATCCDGRWSVSGSRTMHCMACCPPPPISPQTLARIAKIFIAPQDPSALVVWRLALRCGHVIETTAHRDLKQMTPSMRDCPHCGERRAHVAAERLAPAEVPRKPRRAARRERAVRAAETELRRA
jgi:hypothetical protein